MIKAIIIDDELKSRESLKMILQQNFPQITIIQLADSVKSGFDVINQTHPDLVFLDIEMPFASGFELLEKFNRIDFEIIFVTAYENYAIKAIKFSALDYILKPVDIDDLREAISRAQKKIEEKATEPIRYKELLANLKQPSGFTKIAIPSAEGLSFLNINDIVVCIADVNYTRIHLLNNEKILVSKTLKEFEDILSDFNFFRIHNSALVNLSHVVKYIKGEGGFIKTVDGSTYEVSRRKKNSFLEKFMILGNKV